MVAALQPHVRSLGDKPLRRVLYAWQHIRKWGAIMFDINAVPVAKLGTGRRKWDVVLYGATGFVGRQTAAYFAQHPQVQASGLRWAIAGRSQEKLQALCNALPSLKGSRADALEKVGTIVADAHDAAALDRLARSATVVLTTAGPFAHYGAELIAACARHGTHYVDITGETPWVHQMLQKHRVVAEQTGARIIPFCGFDSIPSDLAAWQAVQAMRERHGQDCVEVKTAFSLRGGLNGGTLASLLAMVESGQQRTMAQPFLLNPEGTAPEETAPHRDPIAPHFEIDFDAWVGPFVMGPVNTRVVRRSAALEGYGPRFAYQEYLRLGRGPVAAASGVALAALGWAGTQSLRLSAVRAWAARMKPAGEGPTEAAMDAGSYRCRWVARGVQGAKISGLIADRGDPGNRATTRMLCEAALALALQSEELPHVDTLGGFWTPASGLGPVLVQRLRAAGMTLQVDD